MADNNHPIEKGYFWYKDDDEWEIVRIGRFSDNKVEFMGRDEVFKFSQLWGEWGEKIERNNQ
jgi:hypothetical protein